MDKQFFDIPGYEGKYQISEDGEVLSVPRKCGYFNNPGKILTARKDKEGYPQTTLYVGGKKKTLFVHRLMALTFIGPCPVGQEVMHLDGNKGNPHKDNIRYGSRKCNLAFMVDHGTVPRSKPGAKLTRKKVHRIREYSSVGISGAKLAKTFGVNPATICDLLVGRTWVGV